MTVRASHNVSYLIYMSARKLGSTPKQRDAREMIRKSANFVGFVPQLLHRCTPSFVLWHLGSLQCYVQCLVLRSSNVYFPVTKIMTDDVSSSDSRQLVDNIPIGLLVIWRRAGEHVSIAPLCALTTLCSFTYRPSSSRRPPNGTV